MRYFLFAIGGFFAGLVGGYVAGVVWHPPDSNYEAVIPFICLGVTLGPVVGLVLAWRGSKARSGPEGPP
jgi:membrane protein DedA with SNARE-associated domain